MTKEEIISSINNRILDEYKKHKNSSNWSMIASIKIYKEQFEEVSLCFNFTRGTVALKRRKT